MRQITLGKSVSSASALVWRAAAISAAMLAVFISATPLSAHASPNVFDDAVFWFRGGKDIDNDGFIQQGEFFDDLHADDTAHRNHQMSMSSSGYYKQDDYASLRERYKKNAKLQKEQVVFPALGASIVKEMQVLHISNTPVMSGGNAWYYPFSVNPRSVFAHQSISNEYTIVSRVRLDDLDSTNYLFKIGYNEADKQGLKLGFFKHPSSEYSSVYKCLGGYCSPSDNEEIEEFQLSDLPVPTNTWVDVAVVVSNGSLRVGIAVPQSLTDNNPTIGFAEKPMWTDKCELLDSDESYCLFCPGNISTYSRTNTDCFLGSIQQLAIWGRALSDQEVMAAFGMPRPVIFRIGLDNGASNEFGGTWSGSTQEIDGLGSWQNIANTMKAGDTWTVNFTALRDEANLSQIFSIKSLPDSAAAQIEAELNGLSLGEGLVAADSRAFWPVAANIIHAGENELVIKRKDSRTRGFLIDAMELGGSLGVGKLTYSSTDDGRVDPERIKTGVPSAADPNPQHWPTKLMPGFKDLHFRVWIDPDVADKASFTLTTAVKSDADATSNSEKFTVYVNKDSKGSVPANTSWKQQSLPLKAGGVSGGWNDIDFYSTSSRTWEFACYRFETVLPAPFGFSKQPGMSVIVR